jgi:hypothetical protein
MTTKENRPAGNGAAHTTPDAMQSIVPWRQDWNEPLTAEDRADFEVLIAAAERGFRLATRCLDCGHFLVNPRSVAAHRGPRCRARAVAE